MKNYIKILALSFATLFMVSSCIKDDTAVLGDEGNTIIKISESGTKALFFSPFLEVKKVDLVDVRRDANSSANLQSVISVVLEDAPDLVDQYNADNGTDFEYLPSDIYTLVADGGVSYINGKYTLNFGAGDFAKNISINLDGSKWDLSKKFAIGFRLTDNGAATLSAEKTEVVVTISIKNKYDGLYEVTGTMVDVAAPSLTHVNDYLVANGYGNWTAELRTVSATECIVFDPIVWSGFYIPITSGGTGLSGYGSFIPIIEFDPNTDAIVSVTNGYGQPSGNTRAGRLDPSGVNQYDASTKSFKIIYNMTQTSVISTPPHVRTTWDETWTYVGSR
ncbi:MAG: hypothetical protein RIR51_2097 [Bacteroidota bacterium]